MPYSGSSSVSHSVMPDFLQPHQVPLSMGFSKQEYCSGLLFSSPGDLPDPRIESGSPSLQADSLPAAVSPPSSPAGQIFVLYSVFQVYISLQVETSLPQ